MLSTQLQNLLFRAVGKTLLVSLFTPLQELRPLVLSSVSEAHLRFCPSCCRVHTPRAEAAHAATHSRGAGSGGACGCALAVASGAVHSPLRPQVCRVSANTDAVMKQL